MNEKYSFKDFTGCNLTTSDPKEFEGEIVGSCFAQENGMREVFPPKMKGVHFRRCNLDNCIIPDGNTIETEGWEFCTNRCHKVQNDKEDWIIDEKGKPIEPLNLKSFLMEKKSIDPADIPADYFLEEEMTKNDYEAFFIKGDKAHQWFREVPEIVEQRTELTTSELKAANLSLAAHFDAEPVILESKTKTGVVLKRVDTAKDGSFIPIMEETEPAEYIKIQGDVTYYKVKGRAYLYQGQEADELKASEIVKEAPIEEIGGKV